MNKTDLPPNILGLIEEFNRSGLRELHVRKGDFELLLSNVDRPLAAAPAGGPVPVAVSAVQPLAAAAPPGDVQLNYPDDATLVVAPNLGTFYRSPKPGAPPFVEVGQPVIQGAELCLIEVMKLFTTVRSEIGGTVVAVLVDDGAMVEAGQPLFAVKAL